MKIDSERISIKFHSGANEVYFKLLDDFRNSIAKIDRRKNEYVFQQLKEQYVNTLKSRLESIARDLMDQNQQLKDMKALENDLSHSIKDYLHRFVQKVQSI